MIDGKPLYERIIVKDLAEPDKTAGGVLIPSQVKDVPDKGKVVKIGHTALLDKDGVWDENLLKEGDLVLFVKYSGIPFSYKGEDYKLINVSEILFVYDDEETQNILAEYEKAGVTI